MPKLPKPVKSKVKNIIQKEQRALMRQRSNRARKQFKHKQYDMMCKQMKQQQQQATTLGTSPFGDFQPVEYDDDWVDMGCDDDNTASEEVVVKSLWSIHGDQLIDWYHQALGRATPDVLMVAPEVLQPVDCACKKAVHKVAFYMLHGKILISYDFRCMY